MRTPTWDAALGWTVGLSVAAVICLSAACVSSMIVGFVAIVAALFVGAVGTAWARRAGISRTSRIWRDGLSVCAYVILLSVAFTQWPVRAVYALSSSALDDAARRISAGERLETPRLAGLVVIRRAEVAEYVRPLVCLWTGLERNGKTGFVQWTGDDEPLALSTNMRLTDGWHFVTEE